MKKQMLSLVAKMAEKSIAKANNSACVGWTYQPKAPKDIKKFSK